MVLGDTIWQLLSVIFPRDGPQAWLADVLARIAEHPNHGLAELMPWHWAKLAVAEQAA